MHTTRRLPAVASTLVFVAVLLPWLSPLTAGPSPPVLQTLLSLTCVAVLLLLAWVRPIGRQRLARISAGAWLGAALASCVIGLLQYFGVSAFLTPWVNETAAGEAFANLRQRNQFATLTNIGLVALLWWVIDGGRRSGLRGVEASRLNLAWPLLAAVLLAAGNAASSSRTGMVQLLLVAGMFQVWGSLRQAGVYWVLLVAGLTYALAAFVLPRLAGLDPSASGILARLQDGGDVCASRFTLWHNVLYLIGQKPWLGWGWGELDYAHFMTLYSGARFCDILDNAHNLPLHLAVELGVPVAVLLCGLVVWLVWRARPWRDTHPARQMVWAVLALILLHSMLEYPLWYGPFQIAAGLCLWLLWPTPWTTRSPRIVAALAAVLLLMGVAYAAWDYRRVSQIYLSLDMRAPDYRDNTLEKIRGSWLFRNQARFAELTTTELNPANAAYVNALARELLHFSPEARVVEKLIESAVMLGRDDEALVYLARYRAAFAVEHARWAKANHRL